MPISPNDHEIIQRALRWGALDATTTSAWLTGDLKGLKSFAPLTVAQDLTTLVIDSDRALPALDSITSLQKLQTLYLRGNLRMPSLAALEQFPRLENLEIGKIFPLLSGLTLMPHTVGINATAIADLAAVAGFPNLRHLELGDGARMIYTQIDDATDFAPVAGLHSLYLLSRKITRLSQLGALTELRSLFAPANKKLTSIGGVERMRRLEACAIYHCSVRDVAPLRGLPLRYLMLTANPIRSLKALENPELVQLHARQLPLKVFDVAADMPRLELLSLVNGELTRVDELARFPSLTHLDLTGLAAVTDFSPLGRLGRLEQLSVGRTAISAEDLERLLELPRLRCINIFATPALASPRLAQLKAQAAQREITLSEAPFRQDEGDKRTVGYFMHAFRGDESPSADLSTRGYHAA